LKEELELQLVKKYPNIFKQYRGDMKQTCMAFGIECGDGWYNIIDKLCEKLSKYPQVEAAQIKEKFGSLRFYIDAPGIEKEHVKEIYKIIEEAEIMSLGTCEVCGSPGRLRRRSWLKTLCDTHAVNDK